MKVGILDYGVGNIKSVYNAVKHVGNEPVLVTDPAQIMQFSHIIAPGVGNFGYVVEQFKQYNFYDAVQQYIADGRYYLGICVGMQMLFEGSEETEGVAGLGVISGKVVKMSDETASSERKIKLPHIGWSKLSINNESSAASFLSDVSKEDAFYFVHTYTAKPKDNDCLLATTEYGANSISAMVSKDNVYGTQFHPERSAEQGLKLLSSYCQLK